MKAAIVAARQEAAALSKDGKTLLGPILPRLMALHNHGKGPEWRTKSATCNSTGGPHVRGDGPPGLLCSQHPCLPGSGA